MRNPCRILHQKATADLNVDFHHDSTPRPDEVTASPDLGSSTWQTPTSPNLSKLTKHSDSAMSYLRRSTLLLCDPKLLSGYVKWSKKNKEMPISPLSSAFHCFHKNDTTSVKRTSRSKIKVLYPTRRKVPSGSKQKVGKGNRRRDVLAMPNKSLISGKRKHSMPAGSC